MFTALKLFFGSPFGKECLVIFAVCLALGAAYGTGRYQGYDSGHSDGRKEGVESQKPVVDELKTNVAALTKLINDDRLATSAKIKKLEAEVSAATITLVKQQAEKKAKRDSILDRYNSTTITKVQESCGLSPESAQALNDLLSTQIENPVMEAKP